MAAIVEIPKDEKRILLDEVMKIIERDYGIVPRVYRNHLLLTLPDNPQHYHTIERLMYKLREKGIKTYIFDRLTEAVYKAVERGEI